MSSTESVVSAFNLADLSAENVIAKIGIDAQEKPIVAAAIRCLFQQMYLESVCTGLSRMKACQEAVELAEEQAQFRWDIYDSYVDNFLRSHKIDRDPMLAAAIMGKELLEDWTDERLKFYFDEKTIHDIRIVDAEANRIMEGHRDLFRPVTHGAFLAHIRALEYLEDINDRFEDISYEEALEVISHITYFTKRNTHIGHELDGQNMGMKKRIEEFLQDDEAPEPPQTGVVIQVEFPRSKAASGTPTNEPG